jgi:ABC-type Fe3+-hydroxamate transport system substrate-binding protein
MPTTAGGKSPNPTVTNSKFGGTNRGDRRAHRAIGIENALAGAFDGGWIRVLEPDLVLTFSDLQAEIAAELIGAGIAVHAFNQRDIAGILAMIRTIGALVGALVEAEALAQSYEARLNEVAASVRGRRKPKVYFEEWDDPLISGIGWVSELVEIAGGEEVFPQLRKHKAAKTVLFRQRT